MDKRLITGRHDINKSAMDENKHGSAENLCSVGMILFDFGGVLAEEGFRNGLTTIARQNGLEPEYFVKTGFDLVYQVGYVLGRASENDYWQAFRRKTGIKGEDKELRNVILSHFMLRPWMMELIKKLKSTGVTLGILSDQTNWLDELNSQLDFFRWFEHVFNSYYLGKSKRDSELFGDILCLMNLPASQVLFVDDDLGNVKRAKKWGLHTLLYEGRQSFLRDITRFCPFLID